MHSLLHSFTELLSVGPYATHHFGQDLFQPVLPLFLDERTGKGKKRDNNLYFMNFKGLLHVLKKSFLLQNAYPFQKEE